LGGIDYIPTTYASGRLVGTLPGTATAPDLDETVLNAYIGLSVKLMDNLNGNVSYNYTDVDSDLEQRSYDRNRISVGVSAEF
jgi:opacity protein-like surface antigen